MHVPAETDKSQGFDHPLCKDVLFSQHCADLAGIYQENRSIMVWIPSPSDEWKSYARKLATGGFHFRRVIASGNLQELSGAFPEGSGQLSMTQWIAELTEVYATLFGTEQVGIRITGVKDPMCPRFHVDHVPARLVHALYGEGSEWYSDPDYVNSGADYKKKLPYWLNLAETCDTDRIEQAPAGSVVLMKGTRWSETAVPVIHRSPRHEQPRLVLTLDSC